MASEFINADICIIGAGSAGLSVAAGAAQMGARTVLIEANRMGGDCLNTGCVPSKALLAAAHAAHAVRTAGAFGVRVTGATVDYTAVHAHVHDVIAQIAPHDSEERFTKLGCTVIRAHGVFSDERTVTAGDKTVRARRYVVATGSRAALPPIPGLETVPYLTNETLFDLRELPKHLIVIGAGPIGCEMAQAFHRLGAQVTILDRAVMLPKDDPEAVAILAGQLRASGITIRETVGIRRVEPETGGIAIVLDDDSRITGTHLLIAAGRRPNTENLNLDKAGIAHSAAGITVDDRLRTSNKTVFAAGDVAGGPQFTHWAGYHAGIILRNALFRLPARVDDRALPWVTYADPELAQVGLTEDMARKQFGDSIRIVRADFAGNDRARAERRTDGFAKAILDRKGRILGATMIGPNAGELIQHWGLAISGKLGIGAMAGMIAPYPTLGEISKRAAGSYYAPMLFGKRSRWLVRLLGLLG
ncbi:FAD-dependent oxidoreductase [Ferrovibrio sp.]|uniref:dihydrolipoyl dehydrogenase family protein n=1 Tax=Ferrovibrio sp. TaxID=1917215 RepID=UPI00262AFDEA|nr:FAD-dependent oxidoreductase [Ferrovibrio sp.]